MQDLLWEHVGQRVRDHHRTDWSENVSLGYPFDYIRNKVIEIGLADFREGFDHSTYGTLSADEKVLLYCFINMKRHFFEALATFRYYRRTLKPLFESQRTCMMIDLGCGPGTAGLALADALERPRVAYLGVDHAKPMLRKAKQLLDGAIAASLLHESSVVATTSSWTVAAGLAAKLAANRNVLINATYLFASESLDVDDVCNLVMAYKNHARVKNLLFTYSNTIESAGGKKFRTFKKRMSKEFTTSGWKRRTIEFRKKRNGDASGPVHYACQLLRFKEEP